MLNIIYENTSIHNKRGSKCFSEICGVFLNDLSFVICHHFGFNFGLMIQGSFNLFEYENHNVNKNSHVKHSLIFNT